MALLVVMSGIFLGCQTPFPKVSEASKVHIRLARSGCFGWCPAYVVDIAEDGSVIYEGISSVAVSGRFQDRITPTDVAALVDRFNQAKFFSLEDEYIAPITDSAFYKTTLSIDGRTKTVLDYEGRMIGMPESVVKLEDEIDRIAGIDKYTKGTSETIETLRRANFNFSMPQAAKFLADALEIGSQAYAYQLIEAGVPLDGRTTRREDPAFELLDTISPEGRKVAELFCKAAVDRGTQRDKSAALLVAVTLDNADMVRRLIAGGADPEIEDARIRGTTTLHLASSAEVARILLAAGLDPTIRTGVMPLPILSTESEEVALVLLHASRVLDGETKAKLAARAREKGWTRLLARLGA